MRWPAVLDGHADSGCERYRPLLGSGGCSTYPYEEHLMPSVTYPDAVESYLAGYRSAATVAAYRCDLSLWQRHCDHQDLDPLGGVVRADLERYARRLEHDGRAPATVARRLAILVGFYRWCADEQLIVHCPALNICDAPAARVNRPGSGSHVPSWPTGSTPVSRHDEWFNLDDVQLNVRPEQQPRPPILLGGMWPATSPVDRAVRWDGYVPYWPGLGEGRDDSIEEGARERELRELLAYYHEQGGDGIVLLPRLSRFGSEYDELCAQLGADWLLTCDPLDVEAVRAGPPRR